MKITVENIAITLVGFLLTLILIFVVMYVLIDEGKEINIISSNPNVHIKSKNSITDINENK